MIKLIVTDLDGTLLDSKGRIPARLPALIAALRERGVAFAAASGRPQYVLREMFGALADDMMLIGHNGASLAYRGELLHFGGHDEAAARRILEAASRIPQLYAEIDGDDGNYLLSDYPPFVASCQTYFSSTFVMTPDEAFAAIPRIYKIALWDEIDAETRSWLMLDDLKEEFDLTLSGNSYIDVMKRGEGKGTSLAHLQAHLGVTEEETLCFGDFPNDLTLMEHCTYSYAMKNAHPDLLKVCRYQTEKTNDEDGVIETVLELFDIKL